MLEQAGIYLEVLGGDIQSVNISALKNINLDELMDAINVQAEIMNLKGDPKGKVEGVIIESSNDPGRGKLATVLIKRGTLKRGDCIGSLILYIFLKPKFKDCWLILILFTVSGLAWAKVRSMFDHTGKPVKEATLCDPVQIIGWRELPNAGEEVLQVDNERMANMVIDERMSEESEKMALEHSKLSEERIKQHLIASFLFYFKNYSI